MTKERHITYDYINTFYGQPMAFAEKRAQGYLDRGDGTFIRLYGVIITRAHECIHPRGIPLPYDLYSWFIKAELKEGFGWEHTKLGPASVERGVRMAEAFVFTKLTDSLKKAYRYFRYELDEGDRPWSAHDVDYLKGITGHTTAEIAEFSYNYTIETAMRQAEDECRTNTIG